MRVLIVEDEAPAVDHLLNMLQKQDEPIEVLEELDSVKSTVRWFAKNEQPDLAFFDIQLADGKSFEIFELAKVTCPIIFTTAYDEYALKAFEVNSIDYLLKPINQEDLARALGKFKSQSPVRSIDSELIKAIMGKSAHDYKQQFLIKVGEHLRTVLVKDIALFYSQDRATYLHTVDGKKSIVDFALDQVEGMLDPSLYFRINRKFIVRMDMISDMVVYSNSRLQIKIDQFESDEMIVSRERVGEFKSWLDR